MTVHRQLWMAIGFSLAGLFVFGNHCGADFEAIPVYDGTATIGGREIPLFRGFEFILSVDQYLPGLPNPCANCPPDFELIDVPPQLLDIIPPDHFEVFAFGDPDPQPNLFFRYVGGLTIQGPAKLGVAKLSERIPFPAEIAAVQFVGNAFAKQSGQRLKNAGEIKFFNSIGDFNGDRRLDVTDVDLLSEAVRSGQQKESYDLNSDNRVDAHDLKLWAEGLRLTYLGDANLDGQFDTSDLVHVFQAIHYERQELAGWSTGDWTGDGQFNSTDLIAAFQSGGYEQGPNLAVSSGNSTWGSGDWCGDTNFDRGEFVSGFQASGYENGPRMAISVPEPDVGGAALMSIVAVAGWRWRGSRRVFPRPR
jgi:hypothetical protein